MLRSLDETLRKRKPSSTFSDQFLFCIRPALLINFQIYRRWCSQGPGYVVAFWAMLCTSCVKSESWGREKEKEKSKIRPAKKVQFFAFLRMLQRKTLYILVLSPQGNLTPR